ncbi:MAG TPA: hypothetical protein VGV16_00150 [Gammaproteobacteria bacterium]|nr:hypothetical protein [Gammaproteobacteria bacterium]
MFKVPVDSLAAYLDFDPDRKADLKRLDKSIRDAAPDLKRHFHAGTLAGEPGMRFKMIGYGKFHYMASSGEQVAWPVIGIALQKNYISVYVSATRRGRPLVALYAKRLHALRAGRNNFSFIQFSDLDGDAWSALVTEVGKVFKSDPGNPVRYWEGN